QIDHIMPIASNGLDDLDNLAYACSPCNSHKSAREKCIDPLNQETAPLFNPREQKWNEHFQWSSDKSEILGLTSIGRATIHCLQLNTIYNEMPVYFGVWLAGIQLIKASFFFRACVIISL